MCRWGRRREQASIDHGSRASQGPASSRARPRLAPFRGLPELSVLLLLRPKPPRRSGSCTDPRQRPCVIARASAEETAGLDIDEKRAVSVLARPRARAVADGCERFVHGAGRRKAIDLLRTIPPETAIDYYGTGGVVEELESEVARLLGKEAALFLPRGTMAQQATLRVQADKRSRKAVAFHPACHLDSHEERDTNGYTGSSGCRSAAATPLCRRLPSSRCTNLWWPSSSSCLSATWAGRYRPGTTSWHK